MSDVKFACPHCAQHIICDEAYCRQAIDCPGCAGKLFVPPLAAFATPAEGELKLALPVGSKEGAFQARNPTLEPWREKEWERHYAATTGEHDYTWVWVFWVLPFPIALVLLRIGLGPRGILGSFIAGALFSGFAWSGFKRRTGSQFVVSGLLTSVAMVAVYVVVGLGILFAGCVLL